MATSVLKQPASGLSRWGPVPIKVSSRSSNTGSIGARYRKSQTPRLALPTQTSVVPTTMKKPEENPNAHASPTRQTADPETVRYVPRLGRTAPDGGHRGAQLRGTFRAPRRPCTHGARQPAADHALA